MILICLLSSALNCFLIKIIYHCFPIYHIQNKHYRASQPIYCPRNGAINAELPLRYIILLTYNKFNDFTAPNRSPNAMIYHFFQNLYNIIHILKYRTTMYAIQLKK